MGDSLGVTGAGVDLSPGAARRILLLGRHACAAMALVWIGIAIGIIIVVVLVRKLLTAHPYDAVKAGRNCRMCGRPTHGLKCPHCDGGDMFGR